MPKPSQSLMSSSQRSCGWSNGNWPHLRDGNLSFGGKAIHPCLHRKSVAKQRPESGSPASQDNTECPSALSRRLKLSSPSCCTFSLIFFPSSWFVSPSLCGANQDPGSNLPPCLSQLCVVPQRTVQMHTGRKRAALPSSPWLAKSSDSQPF